MEFWLGGFEEGREEDPMVTGGAVLDQPVIPPPVGKDRREDLQLWSALSALGNAGLCIHPVSVHIGQDPPDRELTVGAKTWGVELTELTLGDLRQSLGPVRQFGRKLEIRLKGNKDLYPHLHGRVVSLQVTNTDHFPKDGSNLLAQLEILLREDKGLPGQGTDLSQGFPQQLTLSGLYGNIGPFTVITNPNPGSQDIVVSSTVQARLFRSEAITSLGRRVKAKDKPGNEVLIVSCGLPDEYGHSCPADAQIFRLLWEAEQSAGISVLPDKPKFIKGIIVHLWSSPNFFVWGSDELPWKLPD